MKFQDICKELVKNNYHIFSIEDLSLLFPKEERPHLRQYVSRWSKKGWLTQLRRGLYELSFPDTHDIPDFFIANKLYAPSYISLETALSYYSIIPEVSMAVTSVTAKTTRQFKNSHGLFLYRSIRSDAFQGYIIENHNGMDILIAEPEKALVDYLYFKSIANRVFDKNAERIDMKRVDHLNTKKLNDYARLYGLNWKEWLNA